MPQNTPIYAYLEKPSMVDFPGRLAAVFFTSGCSFRCGYCHNASLMGRKQNGLSWQHLRDVTDRFRKDWVNGAVITGGEPTESEQLPELIRFLNDAGFQVKLDTNGSRPDRLAACLPLVDYVAMDIKTGHSAYSTLTGFEDSDAIRRSINLIREEARDYEFRTTVIEALHTEERMDEIGTMIHGAKRYILQPFLPRQELPDPYYRDLPRTRAAYLQALKNRIHGCADEILLRGT